MRESRGNTLAFSKKMYNNETKSVYFSPYFGHASDRDM